MLYMLQENVHTCTCNTTGHALATYESSEGLFSITIPNPRESHPVPAQVLPNL